MYALLPVLLGSEVVRCLVLGLPEGHRHSGPLWRRRSGLCGLTGRHRFLGLPVPHAPISIFKGAHTHALGTVGRQTRWWVSVDPLRQRQRAWAATSRAELVERQGWMLERERVGCEIARAPTGFSVGVDCQSQTIVGVRNLRGCPWIWDRTRGFRTSDPVRPNLNGRIGGLKVSRLSVPDI